jgi:hypothetical protein
MKSAFELAMERMDRESGPSKKLSDAQRAEIADIDERFEAKIAEQRLAFEPKIATAPFAEQGALKQQLAEAIAALELQRDGEKDRVWNRS